MEGRVALGEELEVGHVVEPGVEQSDFGNHGQCEKRKGDERVDIGVHAQLMRFLLKARYAGYGIVYAEG